MFAELRVSTDKANAKLQEANVKLAQAKTAEEELVAREKRVILVQSQLANESARITKLTQEYEEKVAKLKSAMV
jgi:hypothetical protein